MTHLVNTFGEELYKLHASLIVLSYLCHMQIKVNKTCLNQTSMAHVPRMLNIKRTPPKERQCQNQIRQVKLNSYKLFPDPTARAQTYLYVLLSISFIVYTPQVTN